MYKNFRSARDFPWERQHNIQLGTRLHILIENKIDSPGRNISGLARL
jgi:hypothetical protein